MRCRPTGAEAVVDRHRDGTGDDAAAGVRLVDPVADRGVLRRPTDDVADRQLADEAAVVLARRTAAVGRRAPRAASSAPSRRSCAVAPATATARSRPSGPARRGWRARTRRQSSRSRWEIGRSTTPRDSRTTGQPALSGRSPRSARRRAAAGVRRPRGRPSPRPGTRAGSPPAPDRPCRRPRATGPPSATPLPTPWARIASAMPGTSRSSSARVTSGVRSVGVRPVPPVVSTARAPAGDGGRDRLAHRLTIGYDDRVADLPAVGPERLDDQRAGRVVVHPGRGAVRRHHHGRRRMTCSSPVRPALAAGLLLDRTSVMTARLVDGLDHVDHRQRRHRHRGQRLHLDTGAVGGPAPSR